MDIFFVFAWIVFIVIISSLGSKKGKLGQGLSKFIIDNKLNLDKEKDIDRTIISPQGRVIEKASSIANNEHPGSGMSIGYKILLFFLWVLFFVSIVVYYTKDLIPKE
jgi:hypothetical protein